jgi:hypothetical protein
VVVVNGDAKFLSAKYSIGDGFVINFGEPKMLDVKLVSEEDIVSNSVQSFLDGKSLHEGLKGLVGLVGSDPGSAFSEMLNRLKMLFSKGGLWRNSLKGREEEVGGFAWDADYGDLNIFSDPIFEHLYEGDTDVDLEEYRDDVRDRLINLESRIVKILGLATGAFEEFRHKASAVRDYESDSVLSQFDAFSEDYLSHLSDVGTVVSEAVRDSGDGCVQCSALVHDEVVKRMKELELGGRFIRKTSALFTQ